MTPTTEDIRKRTWQMLGPEIAACAGMTVEQQQQFIAHEYTPTAAQLNALARRYGMLPGQRYVGAGGVYR